MLFNSFVFAFLFLPIVLFGCAVFSRPTFAVAIGVLAMAGLYRMMEAGYEEFLYRFF